MNSKGATQGTRVVVIGHRHIGDTILTEPALRFLSLSDFRVTLLVKSQVALTVSRYFFSPPRTEVFESFREGLSLLRKGRFEAAVLLDKALGSALMTFLACIPRRIGYGWEGRGIFLTHAPPKEKKEHHLRGHLRLVESAFGTKASLGSGMTSKEFPSPPRLIFPSEKLRVDRPFVLLHIGTTRPSKAVPVSLYKRIAAVLKAKGMEVWLCGDDRKGAVLLAPFVDRSLVGETSFDKLCQMIASARAIIAPDTGPMHLAAGFGIPVLGLFGSTDPGLTGPVGLHSQAAFAGVPCSPCLRFNCKYPSRSPKFMRCMQGLAVEEMVENFLKENPSQAMKV